MSKAVGAIMATACVLPATIQILLNATCDSLKPLARPSVAVSGMAGEFEHAQVLMRLPAAMPPSVISAISLPGLDGVATIRQVGYVNCSSTSRYPGSGGGWRPDPLLPLDPHGTLLMPGVATPLWLSIRVPQLGGHGTVVLELNTSQRISVAVNISAWRGLDLPTPLALHKDFCEIWSFETGDLQRMYGSKYTNETAARFRKMNTDALLPPDALYKQAPYSDPGVYDYLRSSGAYLLNLGDLGGDAKGCPEPYSNETIRKKLDIIAPTIEYLGNGTDIRPYVYGYDEQPPSCEANIRALYGALKTRWPHVATAAVLNWPGGLPVDLPVDIWIVQYEDFVAKQAQAWQRAGKQVYAYHCIEPSKGEYLNTFIEKPRTQGRQLYWLAASQNIDGWLYYATDLWRPRPGSTKHPLQRIARSPRTDFDPSNHIWAPRTDIFANGDGQFVYPGLDEHGAPTPIASARLELQRDAVEDVNLLRRAQRVLGSDRTNAFIHKLVRSPTDHTDDPALLENTRREVASALVEQMRLA